jgi:ABC-type transporter Mla subunit MlaD
MLETKAVIWSVAFFLVILFLILFLWQMWRTAKSMATALEALNKNLPEILANMQEITANINSASALVKHEAEEFVVLSRKVRAFLGVVTDVEETLLQGVRLPLVRTLRTARGLLKGGRVFLNVFLQKDQPRQRDGR